MHKSQHSTAPAARITTRNHENALISKILQCWCQNALQNPEKYQLSTTKKEGAHTYIFFPPTCEWTRVHGCPIWKAPCTSNAPIYTAPPIGPNVVRANWQSAPSCTRSFVCKHFKHFKSFKLEEKGILINALGHFRLWLNKSGLNVASGLDFQILACCKEDTRTALCRSAFLLWIQCWHVKEPHRP